MNFRTAIQCISRYANLEKKAMSLPFETKENIFSLAAGPVRASISLSSTPVQVCEGKVEKYPRFACSQFSLYKTPDTCHFPLALSFFFPSLQKNNSGLN